MTSTGRIPLWIIALVGGLAVIVVLSAFIYGSYSGLGSSLWNEYININGKQVGLPLSLLNFLSRNVDKKFFAN